MFLLTIFVLGVLVALPAYILTETQRNANPQGTKPIAASIAGFTGLLFSALAGLWPEWSMAWGHIAASEFLVCITLTLFTAFSAFHLLSMPKKFSVFFMFPVVFSFIEHKADRIFFVAHNVFEVLAIVSPFLILLFTIIKCILRNRRITDES